jgi:hypothetical protein
MDEASILIVIDPERVDHPALEHGVEFAQRLDAVLELYTCDFGEGVPERWAGSLSLQQFRSMVREQRLQLLEELAQPLRARGVRVRTHSDWYPSLEQGVLRRIVAIKPGMVLEDELYGMRERILGSGVKANELA